MRKTIVFTVLGFLVLTLLSLTRSEAPLTGVDHTIEYYKKYSVGFASSAAELQNALLLIKADKPATVLKAKQALKNCRLSYKRIEFFLEYFFKTSALIYNGPPKYEVEEPYMEWQTPIGLQVMEGLLFEKDLAAQRSELLAQADVIASSAKDLNALLYGFTANDKQIMESLRLELVRIYTLGISGFDAPLLKSGIEESFEALSAVSEVLDPYLDAHTREADSVSYYLKKCLGLLQRYKTFDSFNRLDFYTLCALPLQQHLGQLIKEMQLRQNTAGKALNYNAGHLFSKDAINIQAFPSADFPGGPSLVALGKKLFSETGLSGNNKVSCATCHLPQKHFSDGLPKSIAFDGHSHLKRNAPSLLYAAFQYEQFWEGRARSLEAQIEEVINNPVEMNGNSRSATATLKNSQSYRQLFSQAFTGDSSIAMNKIAASIAAYVRTLNPRNSAFDKYMEGNRAALSERQKRGFNLFMGKAQCGTCHFAPLFNGLVPPLFDLTELEVLGTPASDNFNKVKADDDSGRYKVFAIDFYNKAFKTPTVRNASATAPYMHNGSFKTLTNVVEFYNKGGGKGLGLPVANQTLSSIPLQLTPTEVEDVVRFIQSLEDDIRQY